MRRRSRTWWRRLSPSPRCRTRRPSSGRSRRDSPWSPPAIWWRSVSPCRPPNWSRSSRREIDLRPVERARAVARPGPWYNFHIMIDPSRTDLCPGAWIDFWPELVPDDGVWLEELIRELPLASETYRVAGRLVAAPRLVSWHGDPGTDYVYSGVRHQPAAWPPALAELRALVEARSGLRFNSALANYYRDGCDGMGWHTDAEPEVGPAA